MRWCFDASQSRLTVYNPTEIWLLVTAPAGSRRTGADVSALTGKELALYSAINSVSLLPERSSITYEVPRTATVGFALALEANEILRLLDLMGSFGPGIVPAAIEFGLSWYDANVNFRACWDRNGTIGRIGCRTRLDWDVTYALGRAVAKGLVAVVIAALDFAGVSLDIRDDVRDLSDYFVGTPRQFVVRPGLLGDLTGDNKAGYCDANYLVRNWHTTNLLADINADGYVDLTDLSIWAYNFVGGDSCPPPDNDRFHTLFSGDPEITVPEDPNATLSVSDPVGEISVDADTGVAEAEWIAPLDDGGQHHRCVRSVVAPSQRGTSRWRG